MTASSPDTINESGVTSTRCYSNRQDCRSRRSRSSTALLSPTIITATFLSNQEAPSPHRHQHPRTLKTFYDMGRIINL
ncbi:hypothetical protein TNCV_2322061 [Trichonephila clavipes]|nr:hypothetical protein TNCV_2322061 [Trichonephila clavipes]